MKVVTVVPTYNERDNIRPLIEALIAASAEIQHEFEILVVDDNSPDGTQDVIRELQAQYPNVRLLTGTKQGLGVAYARGLESALSALHADIVVHMDADFSHNPADVPRLIAEIDAGHDLVVGSRYIPGGRLSEGWGITRKLISRVANFGVRMIAGIGVIHDCTGGFRAYRSTLLRRVTLDAAPRGYAVLTYLAYNSLMAGAKVTEVPITFANRAEGTSKLRMSDAAELFLNAWWIRYDRRERFYRRATGGVSGVAVNLALVALLYYGFDVPRLLASALSIEASILFSFGWRESWGLALGRPSTNLVGRLLRTQLLAVPSFAFTFSSFAVLVREGVSVIPAQALGIVPAMLWNYFVGDRALDLLRRRNMLHDMSRAQDVESQEDARDVRPI
ncbi:MAG: glycosyltransferase family 2 protein [Chloroflexota bacterium]|nr:glycosyltransferase family 2 protein [Chloroflexota bacterium]